jgi:integrase
MIPLGKVWHCRFTIDKKRHQHSTKVALKHRNRAMAVAKAIFADFSLRSKAEKPTPTLGQAFEIWERDHILRRTPAYVESVSNSGRAHLGPLKNTLLTDLTTEAVVNLINNFRSEGHKQSSANLLLTHIRTVCKWAISMDMLNAIPFNVKKIPIKQKHKKLIPTNKAKKWLEKVIELCRDKPHISMCLHLQIGLGLRGKEAREARWECLDLERNTYTPERTKGGEAWPRLVPEWIMGYLRPKAKAHGWMIPTKKDKPVCYMQVHRVFHAACEALGLKDMVPHRLRATYATWLIERGVSPQNVQIALGHKDFNTTLRYLGHNLEQIAAAQKRIAQDTGLGS